MNENNENKTNLPEGGAETEASPVTEEKKEQEYFEKQYFEGDSLKELEGSDDDDDDEYLASFDKASDVKSKSMSSGMKRSLITLGCVFGAAIVLFCLYFFVFKRNANGGIDTSNDYKISDNCLEIIGKVDKDVQICFRDSEATMKADDYGKYVSAFAVSFDHQFEHVSVVYENGSDYCTVKSGSASKTFTEEEFFEKLETGARYAFNGERLYGSAILEVTSKTDLGKAEDFSLWALPGYDLDGDTVSGTNRPFVYPNITRSDIKDLTVTNKNGSFKVYRTPNGSYVFENAELCNFDQELFSSLIVNCTYMLSMGKVTDAKSLEDYGLAGEEGSNATIVINTVDEKYHKILIGDELPSGGGYYAKYYSKPFIYVLDGSYSNDVLQPVTKFLTANLGYTIGNTNDIYNISDLLMYYTDSDTSVYVGKKTDIRMSNNFTNFNSKQTVPEILHNKTKFTGTYSDWTKDETFAGFTPKDNNNIEIELQPTNYAVATNEYAVKLGLVRDSEKKAELPNSITVYVYDSDIEGDDNAKWVQVASLDSFDQGDKSYKYYTVNFKFEKQVKRIKLSINAVKGSYLVIDEVTAFADGKDAIPNESVSGVWKILSPDSFIPYGYNYASPDTSAFSDIIYGVATLTGDEVVEYNIYHNGDENFTSEDLDALLEKYGLLTPAITISFEYDIYRSYIYTSALDTENNCYYAYAVIRYTDDQGITQTVSTNIIAKINYDTAYYLSWAPTDLLERACFSMYIDKIDTIEMSFGGNDYLFDLQDTDNNGKMDTVAYNGGYVDTNNFRYVYVSVLNCSRAGLYTPKEGDISEENKLFTFRMHSELKDTEITFYRVSSTKVIYCTNGQDSEFYVLYSDVSTVMSNVIKLINGEDVPR